MIRNTCIVFAACLTLSGCGTIHSAGAPDGRAYGGVRQDMKDIRAGAIVGVLDLPVSAVADTVLLPGVLLETARNRSQ